MLHRENTLRSLRRLSSFRSIRIPQVQPSVEPIISPSRALVILAQTSRQSDWEERAMLQKLEEALKKQNLEIFLSANTNGRFEIPVRLKNSPVLLVGVSEDSIPAWFTGRTLLGPTAKELLNSPQKKKEFWSQILSFIEQ